MSKVVVVTGASAGIGEALAEQLVRRGDRVVLAARRAKELDAVASRLGEHALAVPTDVTVRAEVERLLSRAVERFGDVDVWVNNAGRGISRPVMALTDEDIDEMIRVNVKSALYGMQVAGKHFLERGAGHVINVSSMLGRIPFAPIRSAYSASKHALNALTANLRMELGASSPKIHVSAVHPGIVATEFGTNALHGGMDSRAFSGAQTAAEVAAVIVDVIEHPKADVYTRPGAREMIASYFGAEDMAEAEARIAAGPMAPRPR